MNKSATTYVEKVWYHSVCLTLPVPVRDVLLLRSSKTLSLVDVHPKPVWLKMPPFPSPMMFLFVYSEPVSDRLTQN